MTLTDNLKDTEDTKQFHFTLTQEARRVKESYHDIDYLERRAEALELEISRLKAKLNEYTRQY